MFASNQKKKNFKIVKDFSHFDNSNKKKLNSNMFEYHC